jgi:hypothetical protein
LFQPDTFGFNESKTNRKACKLTIASMHFSRYGLKGSGNDRRSGCK